MRKNLYNVIPIKYKQLNQIDNFKNSYKIKLIRLYNFLKFNFKTQIEILIYYMMG